MDNDVV